MEAIDLMKGLPKKHHARKSGVKADKKSKKSKGINKFEDDDDKNKKREKGNKQNNPRAFSVANIIRTKRSQQRNLDRQQKKEVVPLIDRSNEELPPPVFIVVMGPKKCGKSTLIRSLVKIFTGQNIVDTTGPITCIAGKKRRITFFECPLDLFSMTDLAKIADLVLLMIDASYGFEMEVFEFLNILQLHGFPKVMGVLTHLDSFKVSKTLQNTKKKIKQRFWTEIYKGAKVFEFSGVINGKYLKHEVKRLSLYISRVKFRPLVWRNTHPYIAIDRVEDMTSITKLNEDSSCNRDVVLFGYVRGTNLKSNMPVHLIGTGDFNIENITAIGDPCPLPSNSTNKSSLRKKDILLYAPMANVGRVQMIDKDGLYINIANINYTKPENLLVGQQQSINKNNKNDYKDTPVELLRSMQDVKTGVDELIKESELSLFKGSQGIVSSEVSKIDSLNEGKSSLDAAMYDDEQSEGSVSSDDEDSDIDYKKKSKGSNDYEDDDEDDDDDVDEDEDDVDYEDEDDEDDDNNEDDFYGNKEDSDNDEEDFESGSENGSNYDDLYDSDNGDKTNNNLSSSVRWKDNMKQKAITSYDKRDNSSNDIMTQIYGKNWARGSNIEDDGMDYNESDDEDDGELFSLKSINKSKKNVAYEETNCIDSNRASMNSSHVESVSTLLTKYLNLKANNENTKVMFTEIKSKFVTGGYSHNKSKNADEEHDPNMNDDDDEEVYDDFEDLETGEKIGSTNIDLSDESDDDTIDSDKIEMNNDKIDEQLRQLNASKKASNKSKFDEDYDDTQMTEKITNSEELDEEKFIEKAKKRSELQRQKNKEEFGDDGDNVRLQYEGFRQGLYVRVLLKNVPAEFISNFNPSRPIIMGGLLTNETQLGYIKARVKRHRWHKRVLKSSDPIIISAGWRRYQTLPVYTIDDINDRERFLKYTPEHMHCTATFYGPIVPPNTGILAYQKINNDFNGFRIALSGTTLELKQTPTVVKKLKLIGTPKKIFKNTAFITGMFNSALEVAKFEGSKLKTVSGIRGQIKKALKDGEPGNFRASFEDKILMSDIIICRLWVPVEIKQYYNPILSLLNEWKGMRTISEIRMDEKISHVVNKDSLYKPIERVNRKFKALVIPKKIQESLPFASKPKQDKRKKNNNYISRRAVILEPEDKKKRALIQTLQTIAKDKHEKRVMKNELRLNNKKKQIELINSKFEDIKKEDKKRKYREEGKEKMYREKKMKRN